MWSAALDVLLTTLRYLAPATILTLFWGQQSFIFKLLKHIDSAIRSIVFSSEEQKEEVLQWLTEEGPVRVEKLDAVWRQGWILCGILDAALPGACAGHPHTSLSLKHAQALADHYLGVKPVFSRQELDSNDSLGKHQEWKLASYLSRIRRAIEKLTPPVSKPTSQRTSPEVLQVTLDYIAKGSGLTAAQVNSKMYFKVYPTSQQSMDPGEVTILIRGPKDIYGMTVFPPILGKAQMIRQKLLGLEMKTSYTENILPLTQGATYLRSYGKNDMNKTYYIPKAMYDIEIEVESKLDHAKVGYVVKSEGIYEISITSRGQNIVGSPFIMRASKNMISILENDTFCLENGEEIDIVDVNTDRKVVLRIVDFVTEKMLLKENGSLERISDDEAKILMETDKTNDKLSNKSDASAIITETNIKERAYLKKFRGIVTKVIVMKKICLIFNDFLEHKRLNIQTREDKSISQQNIPDIVNSIMQQKKSHLRHYNSQHIDSKSPEKIDKIIIPANISVSIRSEKAIPHVKEQMCNDESNSNDTVENPFDVTIAITPEPKNPFFNDFYDQNYTIPKDLGCFASTEYETNNLQNEEVSDTPKKILFERCSTPTININPFLDPDVVNLERPKTPILKIISGDIENRDDSVYINPKSEQLLNNEFVNPFFMHQHVKDEERSTLTTDFIIGAPVSLPPIIKASTPEPIMESISNANNEYSSETGIKSIKNMSIAYETICPFPIQGFLDTPNSSLQSLSSSGVQESIIPTILNNTAFVLESNDNTPPRKDMWDSAYVSIDDNSSPDSNNNENSTQSDMSPRPKHTAKEEYHIRNKEEMLNIGPAEREIWECEFNKDALRQDESKSVKSETKRPAFTPIIEESDRSISIGMKEHDQQTLKKNNETEYVSVAFAELNSLYHEYFPNMDSNPEILNEQLDNRDQARNDNHDEVHNYLSSYTPELKNVNSASEFEADVMRHVNDLEGKTSEVQPNVTESISASQALHANIRNNNCKQEITEKQDRYTETTNLVLQKKKFWDDKIQQIQAKTEEVKVYKKKRSCSKPLKHNDSLSKKKGKHIVKNFLSAGGNGALTQSTPTKISPDITQLLPNLQSSVDIVFDGKQDGKLVDKWKKYWNERLETEREQIESSRIRISPQRTIQSPQRQQKVTMVEQISNKHSLEAKSFPARQDVPEEVFKAFETSPKRFFGTSRKQILNKIDSFLAKPDASNFSTILSNSAQDSGLVSSRISLFHNIIETEKPKFEPRKSKSLHNIYQRKNSAQNINMLTENTRQTEQSKNLEYSSKENNNPDKIALLSKEKKSDVSLVFGSVKVHSPKEKPMKPDPSSIAEKNSLYSESPEKLKHNLTSVFSNLHSKNVIQADIVTPVEKFKLENTIRKTSFSKSEMDIFNKTTKINDYTESEKYKSCEELPKINVKNFITMYETVTKAAADTKITRKGFRNDSTSSNNSQYLGSYSGGVNKHATVSHGTPEAQTTACKSVDKSELSSKRRPVKKIRDKEIHKSSDSIFSSVDIDITSEEINKNSTYLSLSEIDLEIIEKSSENSVEPSPERDIEYIHTEYKSRFKMAKQYFQSLEELREEKKPSKLNECEILLYGKKSQESPVTERPQRRVKKNIKSHSMPSSEISRVWNQLKDNQQIENSDKPVKISEKFNIDDFFHDVMEGRLSRQGSLRGIPHKRAVLETFRSMENVSNNQLNSYEIAISQLKEPTTNEKMPKNAQAFLSEYPYLPTTDPSKYHSRLDARACGLISMKELLSTKPRRNSVPDLRLNPAFTVNL